MSWMKVLRKSFGRNEYKTSEVGVRLYDDSDEEDEKMQKGEAVSVLPWKESIGFISMEYAYLYPPGTPMIVPGERITKEITDALRQYERLGFSIEGLHTEGCIEVWNNG